MDINLSLFTLKPLRLILYNKIKGSGKEEPDIVFTCFTGREKKTQTVNLESNLLVAAHTSKPLCANAGERRYLCFTEHVLIEETMKRGLMWFPHCLRPSFNQEQWMGLLGGWSPSSADGTAASLPPAPAHAELS